ncbi:MAG: exonuclease SbcCD subunit D [Treponema sp.]|nr:exonuclease SbcCD subunit D [Treponema sp.]
MKLLHIADLHLGKRVNEFSLLEDQHYILTRILTHIENEMPDALLIAGDVYDKGVPPIEAITLFDDFLSRLFALNIQTFIISGNHDSPERMTFGSRLMQPSGIHFAPTYDGTVSPTVLSDRYGELAIYLLPFIKPAVVRPFFPDETIDSYTDAVRAAVTRLHIDTRRRNVLVAHQFVTGAERSESEEISVGGSDNIPASVFADFDYVALGHIHRPQNIGTHTIRYCGTPLKYSFSESRQEKSITVVELEEKGTTHIRTIPLVPLHDMRELKGRYEDLTFRPNYEHTQTDDYIHITLTDEDDIPEAVGKLRAIYPHLMKLDYDNMRTQTAENVTADLASETFSPLELFAALYELQNNQPLSDGQRRYVSHLIESLWEHE